MKRIKRHKIKREKSASSQARGHEEHDLAYFIHDRVELMHQVFSILKYKELKAMAPECVRNLAIGDLEELCTEELLGISSKRLVAILDGAEPPSDTESSSASPPPDELETISLDSISSDEEILNSNHSKKKKHKHRSRRNSKKKDKDKDSETNDNGELSKASRAGLTVLELLELQARARAIRAQLQQEQIHKNIQQSTTVESSHHSSDNEVEIKEEPPDVVEISSEDEKPNINELKNKNDNNPAPVASEIVEPANQTDKDNTNSETVVKRINDLIITVPQAKTTRKIKLNRNKVTISVSQEDTRAVTSINETPTSSVELQNNIAQKDPTSSKETIDKSKEGKVKKKKKDKKKKSVEKDGSDHDEITLQLSDSEKMDLLEDLDESRKNYDKVSSSSEDSESSSSSSETDENLEGKTVNKEPKVRITVGRVIETVGVSSNHKIINHGGATEDVKNITENITTPTGILNNDKSIIPTSKDVSISISHNVCVLPITDEQQDSQCNFQNIVLSSLEQNISSEKKSSDQNSTVMFDPERNTVSENVPTETITCVHDSVLTDDNSNVQINSQSANSCSDINLNEEKVLNIETIEDIPVVANDALDKASINKCIEESQMNSDQCQTTEKSLSEGEVSDRESSEVEAVDIQPDVVCISDEGSPQKKDKKKKKKEKKSKKSKKSTSDFREPGDQNFYRESGKKQELGSAHKLCVVDNSINNIEMSETIDLDSDEVLEIFELSDDSSCSEIEGALLSKEPTAEEIEALSAKIDEIKREEVVTDKQIQEHEQMMAQREKDIKCNESDKHVISWRERYLDSNKVKKVLTTANIFNALRKKNKDLKKKIEERKRESKKKTNDHAIENNIAKDNDTTTNMMEEGSIEQYNTLEGSTKYVDPVKESIAENNELPNNEHKDVIREMKKDAKQLLKMYRRLLKYNALVKPTDPNKKKKKKQKRKEKPESLTL